MVPDKLQARTIIKPEIEKLQAMLGVEEFVFSTTDSFYQHKNGSKLFLIGSDDGKAKSSRGTATHILAADEFGFWRYPEVLKEVFAPQLRTTKGQLIIASTPPPDLGHEYYTLRERAIAEERFIRKIITDDSTATDEVMKQIIRDCGGVESAAYRREYLCEPVADPESLVVPEFDDRVHVYDELPIPPFYDAYVGIDLGFHDNTALLFGYYDFEKATLVIQDELVMNGKNSKEICDRAKAIENKLWGRSPYLRVSDNEIQQLHDMATMFDYITVPTRKDDKDAAINALRLRFTNRKILINRKCQNLIFQLKVGMWNETKKNYLRGDKTGHLDAIDALIYLNRNINATKNPYPNPTYQHTTHFINPEYAPKVDKDTETLFNSLSPFPRLE